MLSWAPFATEFMAKREVSDATLAAVKSVLGGDRRAVDLVGTMGPYQISSRKQCPFILTDEQQRSARTLEGALFHRR